MRKNGKAALLAALAWMGCGSGAGACPPGTDRVGDGCVQRPDASAMADASSVGPNGDASAAADSGVMCDPAAIDEIDLSDRDENCDGVDGVADDQWYVAPATGDDSNTGTSSAPFRTIGHALRAVPRRPILVALGANADEHFESWAPVRQRAAIHGGYDSATWRRASDRSIVRVGASGQELRFFDANPELLLERVEIVGADADPSEPGASALALLLRADDAATGARAVLRDSVVRAGRGAQGADGSEGDMGLPGRQGVEGCACVDGAGRCIASSACTGSPVPPVSTPTEAGFCHELRAQGGSGGAGRARGQSSIAGRIGGGTMDYANGGDGESGRSGSPGADGAVPTSSLGEFELADDVMRYVPPQSQAGAVGVAGEGGGGGGGGGYSLVGTACEPADVRVSVVESVPAGGGGSGGDGGCGGAGGGAGGAGGASIAIVARGVTVVLEGTQVETSAAGLGGDGGSGGIGGPGGGGGAVRDDSGEIAGLGSRFVCGVRAGSGSTRSRAGGVGGSGGDGGVGGAGAGGAGGSSIGIALRERAMVERDDASLFVLGVAGVGGASAGNRGPDGVRAEVRELRER